MTPNAYYSLIVHKIKYPTNHLESSELIARSATLAVRAANAMTKTNGTGGVHDFDTQKRHDAQTVFYSTALLHLYVQLKTKAQ